MKRRHSLSGRLLALFLLTGLALALVVRSGFHLAVEDDFRDLTRPHIAEYLRYLLDRIGHPPDPARAADLARRLPLGIAIDGPDRDWSTGTPPPTPPPEHLRPRHLPGGGRVLTGMRDGRFLVVVREGDYRVTLVFERWRTADQAPLAVAFTIAGVLMVLVLAYHAIRRLFRPIETVRDGLARIGAGELDHRLELHRRDELGELARSVNAMAADIQGLLEAKRQLLLAVSHELRSPLTRARVHLALLPESGHRDALATDLGLVDQLLEELLEGERLSGRHAALNLGALDPSALVREVLAEHFPGESLETDLAQGLFVAADAARLRLLVRNLANNALRHTPPGAAPPRIAVALDAAGWILVVSDHGPGIPPEHLPHVTEPFYRADPARRRETGGYGLGLYLCKAICEAHGGTLELYSDAGGTRVTCRFGGGDTE